MAGVHEQFGVCACRWGRAQLVLEATYFNRINLLLLGLIESIYVGPSGVGSRKPLPLVIALILIFGTLRWHFQFLVVEPSPASTSRSCLKAPTVFTRGGPSPFALAWGALFDSTVGHIEKLLDHLTTGNNNSNNNSNHNDTICPCSNASQVHTVPLSRSRQRGGPR